MKFRRWLIVILCCFGIAAGLAWIKYSQIQQAIEFAQSFPEPMETVEFAITERTSWHPELDITAEIVATRSIELRNELSGRIVEVNFAAGETVAKGQVLVRQDTSQEEARLAAAVADSELAALEYERIRKLVERNVASESERDQTLARRNSSVAEQRALQAIIDKKNIVAPFDAISGLHELEVGEYLEGGTLISRLVGVSDEVWVDFTLPQAQAVLQTGDTVRITAPGILDDAMPARIIARDAWVDTRSRNVRFRAITGNADGRLSPGLSVTVNATVGSELAAVKVPNMSVRYDLIGPHVFVLDPIVGAERGTDRARRRPVTPGPELDQMIVISTGLQAGERVAANGAFKLREGLLVNAIPVSRGPETPLVE